MTSYVNAALSMSTQTEFIRQIITLRIDWNERTPMDIAIGCTGITTVMSQQKYDAPVSITVLPLSGDVMLRF